MEIRLRQRNFFDTAQLNDTLKGSSIRGGMYTGVSEAGGVILRVASIAILARILIPEHFGLISMVTALTVIGERFKDLGFSFATVQAESITHEQVTNLFWINLGFGAVLTLITALSAKLIAWFYSDNRLIWITLAISMNFLFGGATVQHLAILRRQMRFKQIAYANISSTIFSTLLSIFLALKGFGYWALVWREVGRSSFQLIFTLILCPWIPGLPSKNTRLSKLVHIGGNITAFNLIFFISQTLDQILIGRFLGPASLGFYRQAYQLVMAPSEQIMYPINFVSESALSKLQNDPIRYRQYYVKILSALSFITIPMMLFVFIHAKDVVLALFGENWTQSIEILQILALGAVIRPILSTTGFVMLTSGKTRRYLILGAVQAIILTVALIIGLNWQLRGVSLARVIPIYLYIPTLITVSFKGTPLNANVFLKSIFPFLVSGISMLIVSSLFLSVVPLASIYSKILATLPLAVIIFLATLICFPRAKDMIKQICVDLYSSILYRQQ